MQIFNVNLRISPCNNMTSYFAPSLSTGLSNGLLPGNRICSQIFVCFDGEKFFNTYLFISYYLKDIMDKYSTKMQNYFKTFARPQNGPVWFSRLWSG